MLSFKNLYVNVADTEGKVWKPIHQGQAEKLFTHLQDDVYIMYSFHKFLLSTYMYKAL